MKQDKAEKMIQKAERKAAKAAQQVQAVSERAEKVAQRQAAQAEKRAEKISKNAEKKAANVAKKAERTAEKAKAAAQKAEEKKAKAMAKAAAKATAKGGAAEIELEEGEAPPKKSKKKLLLIALPVVVAAVGVGAFFFLRGGEKEPAEPEPIEIPLEYVLNELKIAALPVWGTEVLVYQEEITPEPPAEPEPEEAGQPEEGDGTEDGGEEAAPAAEEETEDFTQILYRYEGLQNPREMIAAYAAVMTTADAGFSTVDETLLRIDPPVFEEEQTSGSVLLARNLPEGGGVQSMLLSWTETGCSVTLDMPEGQVRDPKPETTAPSGTHRWSVSDLRTLHPSVLGLPGESMDVYELMPQEGSVLIEGSPCMRVNIYDEEGQIAGNYFLSADGRAYVLDVLNNRVRELELEAAGSN